MTHFSFALLTFCMCYLLQVHTQCDENHILYKSDVEQV